MKDKIKDALLNATDEIFLEWQAKLHVVEGANDPLTVCVFDNILDQLAEQMVLMLNEQPKLGITKLTMLDGTEIDLSKLTMCEEIVRDLSGIEHYLREKEVI